jgi:DNA invertase Pin-like site-specific DNA recombinase
LYCRLSPRPDGSYEGVDDQETWGRRYAARVWPGVPVEVFADRGISAANGDERPDFERLRRWVRGNRVARVWTVEQSRLTRGETEWFAFAAELDAAGITELHTDRDGVVRVHDEVAGIKAVLNAAEVRKLRRRVNDRLGALADEGRAPGSRPFGYVHAVDDQGRKTYVVVPEQAEAIRFAAGKVLAGWSLSNIARDLRRQGVVGAFGGKIGPDQVRNMVTLPTIAGQRVHQGRIVGPGIWPAILDRDTWEACRAKLSGSRTVRKSNGGDYPVTTQPRVAGRRYLLTGGLTVCGVCTAPMVGAMKQFPGRTLPYLMCHPNRGGKGCTGIMLDPVEKFVLDELWAELDKPAFLDAVAADEHAQRRGELANALASLDTQRKRNARRAGLGEIGDDEWQALRQGLTERERQLRSELAELPAPLIGVDITTARSGWPVMTLDERREFVRLFIRKITVNRATRASRLGVDTNRIGIEWRTLRA